MIATALVPGCPRSMARSVATSLAPSVAPIFLASARSASRSAQRRLVSAMNAALAASTDEGRVPPFIRVMGPRCFAAGAASGAALVVSFSDMALSLAREKTRWQCPGHGRNEEKQEVRSRP